MRVVHGDRILHQRHDAHGRRDRFAFEPLRLAAAVPALVELPQPVHDGPAEAQPLGEPLRDLAVPGERIARHALRGADPAHDAERLEQRRRAVVRGADVPREHAQYLGQLARIDGREVAPQRQLVAEQRREHVRVRVAADVAQQRLVVDLRKLRIVEAERFTEPHADGARPQCERHRLPHREIGRERQRRDHLGQPDGSALRRHPLAASLSVYSHQRG